MASKNFTVRIDDELEDAIRDNANAMGLSVSDYVRLAMANQNQRKATAILVPCIDGSERNTVVVQSQDDAIDTLRQELLEFCKATAIQSSGDCNTALQAEIVELRAAIALQVEITKRYPGDAYATVGMLNMLRADIWGVGNDCDLVVGEAIAEWNQELLNVGHHVRVCREELAEVSTFINGDFGSLPAELARQDKRIDMWVEQVKMRDAQTLEHKAEVEEIVKVYGKLVKGVEHNCDRLEVLEKVNKITHKTASGVGFGK